MPQDIIHTIGSTIYFFFFLLFLWARGVPRTNPGAGWWAVAMAFAFVSRLALMPFLPAVPDAPIASAIYLALNVVEKFCLVVGLIRFFEVDWPLRRFRLALVAVELWIALCFLLEASGLVRGIGIALFNCGFLACAAWIAFANRNQIDRRLMLALAGCSALLVLHWASAYPIIEMEPSWGRNAFLLGTGLVMAQYFCLLAIVLASFQQRLLEAESRALDMAFQDPLTGLSNQRYMSALFEKALVLANRPHQLAAVLYIDIDNFKPVNDRGGHRVGDEVLKGVAARLRDATRSTDICARIGGDEFAVICTQLDQPEQAGVVAEKLLEALARPFEVEGRRYVLGASIGISLYPLHGDSLRVLLERADQAMYRIKSGGKNGYCVCEVGAEAGAA